MLQGVERLQRLLAWRRPLELGCCAPLPGLRGQPAAADGRRDETYCSYLEHAQPGGHSASTKPKNSSGRPNWSTPASQPESKEMRSGTAPAPAVWGLRFQAGSERRCDRQFGELPIPSKISSVHFCCNWQQWV